MAIGTIENRWSAPSRTGDVPSVTDVVLPQPRGPLSSWALRRLVGRPTSAAPPVRVADPLTDDDFHVALHVLHDLEYRALEGVGAYARRDPLLLALRMRLDDELLDAAVDESRRNGGATWIDLARHQGAAVAVDEMLAAFDGPSLSSFVEEQGTRRHVQEFMVHRSAYQLKEADPHTFGLARLRSGARKSAYAEIQFDEYGNGTPGQAHAELFAAAMRRVGLVSTYGHYVDALPATTLATSNLLDLFAGRFDLLAPLVGHLALFEMTSVTPMSRYARAARRLGLGDDVERFYDVHVVADAHHGDLARRVLLGDRTDDELDPAGLVFGAHALLCLEDRFARSLLTAWSTGGSALLPTTCLPPSDIAG